MTKDNNIETQQSKTAKKGISIGQCVLLGTAIGLAYVAGPALLGVTATGTLLGIPFSGMTGMFALGGAVGAYSGLAVGVVVKGTEAIVKDISNIIKKRRLKKVNRQQTENNNQRSQIHPRAQNRTSVRQTLNQYSNNHATENIARSTATSQPAFQAAVQRAQFSSANLDWSGIAGPVRPSQFQDLNGSSYGEQTTSKTRGNRPPSARGRCDVIRR